MEPHIQYAKTEDGVSIAYFTMGDGVPLVVMPPPFSDMESEWRLPDNRGLFYQRLADQVKVVRYDNRGSGSSQHDVANLSLLSHKLDLEAVVDQLGLEELVLFVPVSGIATAIDYAVRFPRKVSRLILWCTTATSSELLETPMFRGMTALLEHDWDLFTETMAQLVYGFSGGEPARRFAESLRESVSYDTAKAMIGTLSEYDVTELLPRIACPTLVMHRRDMIAPSPESAKIIAASIPGARLDLVDGSSILPYLDDLDGVLRSIFEFLELQPSEVTKSPATATPSVPSGTAVILFADIVDSTALTERMGDDAFRQKARELDEALRKIIRKVDGTPIEGKLLGDGVLSLFTSAKHAIDAAMQFGKAGEAVGLGLHLGIHAGDVIREGDNVFGGAVNIAARISSESEAGEVLVSDTVRGLARTSAGVAFEDRGERELKGIDEPQRLYAVMKGD